MNFRCTQLSKSATVCCEPFPMLIHSLDRFPLCSIFHYRPYLEHRSRSPVGVSDTVARLFNTGVPMVSKFVAPLVRFLKQEDGPTAVEYAVMLALIIVVCITAITTLGKNANGTFQTVGNAIAPTAS